MPRSPDLAYKASLLGRATDYLLTHGLTTVSLRDLAEATGVSSRMLVHHFGSKEHLVVEALGEARCRQRTAFEARLKAQPGRPYADVVADAWRWMGTEEAAPYLRLFGELHALATTPESPYADFARRSVIDWLPALEDGFLADGDQPAQAQRLATLTLAVTRGLLLDRNATKDRARVDGAQALFVQLLTSHRSQRRQAVDVQTSPVPGGSASYQGHTTNRC